MRISMIAAMANNRIIGRDNQMPWHLPADLKHFKAITLNKPVVMGRKTFESIGKALPQRRNYVLTRARNWHADHVHVIHQIEQALNAEKERNMTELMIIGGGQLYQRFLPLADRLYLTLIHFDVEGDTQFPDYQHFDWQVTDRQCYDADDKNPYRYEFIRLDRNR
ncbi:MAG: Dihydrofolate reductase type 3 [Candidatus Celerinatantimonas neptuna]|nr:MAG: Dihydrofolate reductase type 3 [Candidatus Celerinatantimonas neptuna]